MKYTDIVFILNIPTKYLGTINRRASSVFQGIIMSRDLLGPCFLEAQLDGSLRRRSMAAGMVVTAGWRDSPCGMRSCIGDHRRRRGGKTTRTRTVLMIILLHWLLLLVVLLKMVIIGQVLEISSPATLLLITAGYLGSQRFGTGR